MRRYCVTVSGDLRARDLGRLERVCGPALVHARSPLTLRLGGVRAIDDVSRAYLKRLMARGADVLFE